MCLLDISPAIIYFFSQQELRTRNPGTTVKIEVESEPNPASKTRTFKRIYICVGPLKKGFLVGKRDYLGLDGTFMKGPYPGMILTAVVSAWVMTFICMLIPTLPLYLIEKR
uniref:Uncharacterized protein n=1 Tax=Lactuca sativa TaxID=4236 RepID=A0A9R1V7X7_LACSA|nr:hypothetical protein LSAT_V11C600321710 [Lactuca sativa]